MKITLDKNELEEIVNNYVKNTLGIEGTVTITDTEVTIDTSIKAIKKEPVKEVSIQTSEPVKESISSGFQAEIKEESIADIQANVDNNCSLFSEEED